MRKYKLVKQDNLKDCGACSLASIIEYYDGYVPIEILREKTKTDQQGTNAYNIIQIAKQLGFESYGIKCELESIEKTKLTLPAIAYTIINNSYKHFVVLYEINFKKKYVVIADPATKIKKLSFLEFKKIYQSVLIILYPKNKIIKYPKKKMFLQDIKYILKKHLKEILLVFIMALFFTVLNILNFIILKNILNNYQKIIYLSLIIFILFKELINYLKNRAIIKFNHNLSYDLTKQVFFHIIKLPYQYYRTRTTGEIITRFQDLYKLEQFICQVLINIFIDTLLIITTSFFLISISSFLFKISFIFVLLYLINYLFFHKPLKNKYENLTINIDKTNSFLYETVNYFETIKGLNLEDNFIKKNLLKFKEYLIKLWKYENICNLDTVIKNIISSISIITILYSGMYLIQNNLLTLEDLLIYNALFSFFIDPIKNIFNNLEIFKEIKIIINRINDLYYLNENKLLDDSINNISINNLTYKLNNQELLKNINLNVRKGDKIILIGKSGSGKSTILKLIKKYYQSNQVLINNKTKGNTNVIYVSQDENLFTDTIYNNIVLDRKISKKEFKNVVDICSLGSIIYDEKLGYETMIEENGFNISGGEKQRIVLARTLLSDADTILLDESLSEVDSDLERKILKKILKYFPNKTIIYVSHRLDNIDLFKKVAKLENKKIEILERRNSYA